MTRSGPAMLSARRALWLGTAMALLSAGLYGANIPAARVASQIGFPGADLIAYRAFLLVPILFVVALGIGQRLRLHPGERGPTLRLAIAASLTAIFYLSAVDHLPVPMAVIVFYTFPLLVMLAQAALDGRRLERLQLGVFATAFAGLCLAIGPSVSGLSGIGVLYAVIASLSSAAMFILAGRTPNAPVQTMFWTQAVMGPLALVFVFARGDLAPLAVFPKAPIAIALAMGAYAIAYVIQLAAAQKISAGRAGLLFLFEPVTAIIVAGFFLGEMLTPLQWAGLVLILGALASEILLDARPALQPDLSPRDA